MQLLLATLFALVSLSTQVEVEDCIAEKFYRLTKKHTACVQKSSNAETSGVSSADAQSILDHHNRLRAQQGAADMQKMAWDKEIEKIAQRWADNCQFEHDKYRTIPGRFSVGQNLAYGYRSWNAAVQAWYDEVSDFTYGTKSANVFSKVGHYTQLVWSNSSKLGCGQTYCKNLGATLYVCNYGPGGNLNWWLPYKRGSPCGSCSGKCDSNKLCDCGGKVCENGGELNLQTCECKCSENWHIPGTCGLNCSAVQEPKACEKGGFYDEKCFVWSNVPNECPNACNVCPYAGVDYHPGGGAPTAGLSAAVFIFSFLSINFY